jgi:hypothetical protein
MKTVSEFDLSHRLNYRFPAPQNSRRFIKRLVGSEPVRGHIFQPLHFSRRRIILVSEDNVRWLCMESIAVRHCDPDRGSGERCR